MTTKSSLKVLWFGLLLSTLNPQLSTLFAQVPSVVSYQGRVQAGGTNFSGTGRFKFALVSAGTNVSRRATAAPTVTGVFITSISVTDGGVGYINAPAVTITDPTGSGATATAQVSGGVVTSITVQSAGIGYSLSPTVTIALPPPSFVYGTLWSNDGTSSAGSEPTASVAVPVQQGLFTVFLGDTNLPNMQAVPLEVFTQPDVHLRTWFSNGAGGFAQLSPDQRVGSVGYAMMAARVNDAAINVESLADMSVTSAKLAANAVTSDRIEDGTIAASDLAPALLNGTFWKLNGNGGTTPAHFLGTIDNRPLEFRVNNQRALRLEPTASNDTVNIVGGSALNFVATGVVGATIGGGGGSGDFSGMAYTNLVAADFGMIGGGTANTIAINASNSVIAGGSLNDIGVDSAYGAIGGGNDNNIAGAVGLTFSSPYSTIGGGQRNNIGTESPYSVIAGGQDNDIGTVSGVSASHSAIGGGNNNNIGVSSTYSTIGGGQQNNTGINSDYSTIGGGGNNTVGAFSQYATIPGGNNNFATNRAFAAGTRARANHSGAFVWGDSSNADVVSAAANSVTFRASGGVRIFSTNGTTAGVSLAANGTSWSSISDRNAKKNFAPVDSREVLQKLAAVPVQQWNYQWETDDAVPHLGPMAQDFKGAFYPGRDDKTITTQEIDGVALAAIQGLNQKVDSENSVLHAENAELRRELSEIKQLLLKLSEKKD